MRLPEMIPVMLSITRSNGSSKERPKTITMRVTRSSRSSRGNRLSTPNGVNSISTFAVVGSTLYAKNPPPRKSGTPVATNA